MGNRITRIYKADLTKHWDLLKQQDRIDIIGKNGAVYHCQLLEVSGNELKIRDFLFNKRTLTMDEVSEVQFDSPSAY